MPIRDSEKRIVSLVVHLQFSCCILVKYKIASKDNYKPKSSSIKLKNLGPTLSPC